MVQKVKRVLLAQLVNLVYKENKVFVEKQVSLVFVEKRVAWVNKA